MCLAYCSIQKNKRKKIKKPLDCNIKIAYLYLPNTNKYQIMKLLEILAVSFYIAVGIFSVYHGMKAVTKYQEIMCGVAEISPDFHQQDRQKCRQIRGHKL